MAVLGIKTLYSLNLNSFNLSLCQMMPEAKVTCLSDQVTNYSLMFEAQTCWTYGGPIRPSSGDPSP